MGIGELRAELIIPLIYVLVMLLFNCILNGAELITSVSFMAINADIIWKTSGLTNRNGIESFKCLF